MEEDCPFFPGEVEGSFQLLDVGHDPEAALSIRVFERAGQLLCGACRARFAAGCQFQQSLCSFGWQVIGQMFNGGPGKMLLQPWHMGLVLAALVVAIAEVRQQCALHRCVGG